MCAILNLLRDLSYMHVTTGAQNYYVSMPLEMIPKVYFSCCEDVNKFVSQLEEYIPFNGYNGQK